MHNSWDTIPIKPDADRQYIIDLGHRTSVAIKQATQDYQRQQMVARMKAMLAAHEAEKFGEWDIV